MVFFTFSTLTLGLAALSTALPSSRRTISKDKFAFGLEAEAYPVLSLNVVQSAVLGNLDLIFQRPSAYPGTPAYLNNTKLEFNASDPKVPNAYGMYFEDVGGDYGRTVPVTAIYNGGKEGFAISSDRRLEAPVQAAFNGFFACNGTVEEEDVLQLFWGNFKFNGSNPDGCVAATLYQDFNVRE